jgi:glutamate carboxypeptidase
MSELLRYCLARRAWLVETILSLVACESPSTDKPAADRCARLLAGCLETAGGQVELLRRDSVGDIVRGTFGGGPRHVLLLGHYDTVWPEGELARQPARASDGFLYGPGVLDMKAGLGLALLAVRALAEGPGLGGRVTLLWTSDEETGSQHSRACIEEEALTADAVLVLEPALPDGSVKTARKGCAQYVLRTTGVAAHAGVEPEQGASAVHELARLVTQVVAWNDPSRGRTVNVGTVRGGSRANVVAESAEAEIDVRVTSLADGRWVDAAMSRLQATDGRVRVSVTGGIDRPPLERTAGVAALYEAARASAADLGLPLGEGATGGGSDGNLTAALGVPTLDGLGAIGGGAHADDEHVLVGDLPWRAALVAGLLRRVFAV